MLNILVTLIIEWGKNKGILTTGTPLGQLEKTEEEVQELREAIESNDHEGIKDAIGDVFVTLVMQADLQGLAMDDCVKHAYQIISKRTGRMEGGVFVKNS